MEATAPRSKHDQRFLKCPRDHSGLKKHLEHFPHQEPRQGKAHATHYFTHEILKRLLESPDQVLDFHTMHGIALQEKNRFCLDRRTIVRCLKNAWKDVARFAKVVQRDELLDTEISIEEAYSGD